MKKMTKSNWQWILIPILIILGIGVVVVFFSGHPIDSDEGYVLNMAWQIWHGKRLYHDFYEFIPPGTAEFILLSWKIWGSASYAAAKLFFAVIWLFSFLGLFLTLREFQKATLKNILILFIFWLAVFYFYCI